MTLIALRRQANFSPINDLPVTIGIASRVVIADCIRRWAYGAELNEREREIVENALTCNRLELVAQIFHDREIAHAR